VYGPKLVATRGFFDDRALESRFLTEEMGQRRLRDDIPINLSSTYKADALHLRNKLLLFRFRTLHTRQTQESLVDRSIEPRLNQVFVPLLSVIADPQTREDLRALARRYNREMIAERGMGMEAQVLEILRDMRSSQLKPQLSIKGITSFFTDRHGNDYERKITTKWIGSIIRKRLSLKTHKSNGVYVIPESEHPKLECLFEKYGISPKGQETEEANEEELAGVPFASPADVEDLTGLTLRDVPHVPEERP
jgi:hypothetical protein